LAAYDQQAGHIEAEMLVHGPKFTVAADTALSSQRL
jgi:hypothetical protein